MDTIKAQYPPVNKTSFFYKVITSMKALESAQKNSNGVDLETLVNYMIEIHKLGGGVDEQIISSLNLAIQRRFLEKTSEEKYLLITPAAKIHFAPETTLDEKVREIRNIFKDPEEDVTYTEEELQEMENSLQSSRESNRRVLFKRARYDSDYRTFISELQLENAKLKMQSEEVRKILDEETEEMTHTNESLQLHIELNKQLQADKEQLEMKISETENFYLQMKKDMIEKLNDTTAAEQNGEKTLQASMVYETIQRSMGENYGASRSNTRTLQKSCSNLIAGNK